MPRERSTLEAGAPDLEAGPAQDGRSGLTPEDLDTIELPDREALSTFTGGLGHIRYEQLPPVHIHPEPIVPLEPEADAEVGDG